MNCECGKSYKTITRFNLHINKCDVYKQMKLNQKLPEISFHYNIPFSFYDKMTILDVLRHNYNRNEKFKNFISKYNSLEIVKPLHEDTIGLHFNGILSKTNQATTVLHFYVDTIGTIHRITKIEDLL